MTGPALAGAPIAASDINDVWDLVTASWTVFTPTWVASAGAPAIGNGTLTGRYLQVGNTVHYTLQLTWGSTTTGGTATNGWLIGLPIIPTVNTNPGISFSGTCIDASASARYVVGVQLDNANRVAPFVSGGSVAVGLNNPFAWATGDILRITGTYDL